MKPTTLMNGNRKWFSILASASDETEILIFDYIGWGGVEAKDFVKELQAITTPKIVVSINTPGGDVFDGLAIYNAMRAHKSAITARVVGLAASIGSVIALGASRVEMAESSFMMIHNAWGFAVGDANDMREMADTLDKVSGQIADIYVARSGKSKKDIAQLMDEETWLTGQEAVEAGLADALFNVQTDDEKAAAAARFDLSCFRNANKAARREELRQNGSQVIERGAEQATRMRRRLEVVQRGGKSQ